MNQRWQTRKVYFWNIWAEVSSGAAIHFFQLICLKESPHSHDNFYPRLASLNLSDTEQKYYYLYGCGQLGPIRDMMNVTERCEWWWMSPCLDICVLIEDTLCATSSWFLCLMWEVGIARFCKCPNIALSTVKKNTTYFGKLTNLRNVHWATTCRKKA